MPNLDALDFDETDKIDEVKVDDVKLGTDDNAIGQARFHNVLTGLSKPINTLPEGENPAGWFVVNNTYVNCDGKTPEQLAKDDPATIQKRLIQSEQRRLLAEQTAANASAEADKVRLASINLQLENQKLQKQLVLAQKIQSTDETKSSSTESKPILPPAAGLTEE